MQQTRLIILTTFIYFLTQKSTAFHLQIFTWPPRNLLFQTPYKNNEYIAPWRRSHASLTCTLRTIWHVFLPPWTKNDFKVTLWPEIIFLSCNLLCYVVFFLFFSMTKNCRRASVTRRKKTEWISLVFLNYLTRAVVQLLRFVQFVFLFWRRRQDWNDLIYMNL